MINQDLEYQERLPIRQARFLLKLIKSADKTSFAEGKSEGGSAKELFRKKIIAPQGTIDRRIRWKLITHFTFPQIVKLKEISSPTPGELGSKIFTTSNASTLEVPFKNAIQVIEGVFRKEIDPDEKVVAMALKHLNAYVAARNKDLRQAKSNYKKYI